MGDMMYALGRKESRLNIATMPAWPPGRLPAQQFCDESERLRVIAGFGLDGLEMDPALGAITRFAARLCETPIALVTMVEDGRQRFLSRTGFDESETPRRQGFCAQAMLGDSAMIVRDARQHPQFAGNPLVAGPPHVRFYAGIPLISSEGAPLGALCVIDRRARPYGLSLLQEDGLMLLAQSVMQRLEGHRAERRANRAIARGEHRFRTILESLPDIAWSANATGEITYINRRWTDYTGLPNDAHDSASIRSAYHPEDIEPRREDWLAALRCGRPYEGEYRLRRHDGSYGWILARAVPVRNRQGEVEGWFGQLVDIDERRRKAQARELVASELAHRIKNIFSVICSLVSVRARGREELRPFTEELVGAISALGHAQEFVRPSGSDTEAGLHELLGALMTPYNERDAGSVAVEGDLAAYGPRAATPLALIFHELATNAVKYGALSQAGGKVTIAIARLGENLHVTWQERGGPAIAAAPRGEGFGSRLIGSAVRGQLGGTLQQDWHSDGLTVTIELPCENLLR